MRPIEEQLSVFAVSRNADDQAAKIAHELGAKLETLESGLSGLVLEVGDERLALRNYDRSRTRSFFVDSQIQRRVVSSRDLLARALGQKSATVIDATAGFGGDSFDFLRRGKRVFAVERISLIVFLLKDAVAKIEDSEERKRISVFEASAQDMIPNLPACDVIFLDPMFEDVEKRSAKPRKAQQLLRLIAGPSSDSDSLLEVARQHAKQRVVVKRPRLSSSLGVAPDHCFMGKSIRYDVYFSRTS
ncbi:MAG: class I SAM-dependent methyltransferase [Proteobacteria bacterium]|jgi:16S rRNA G966 N2-methylase RsmD|nr:class I SAM-dependent methyltransferase [Pseudomonadota bacterium]